MPDSKSRGYRVIQVEIANGASLSAAVDLGGAALVAIDMPSAWTAADLTFAACDTLAGTYDPVYDDAGNELTAVAAASRVIVPGGSLENLAPLRFLKVRSGTSGAAVNQGAARTLQLIVKG